MQTTTEPVTQAAALAPYAQAFALWEDEYRKTPDNFLTADETARMAVAPLSEQRAICLFAYLREIGATPISPPPHWSPTNATPASCWMTTANTCTTWC